MKILIVTINDRVNYNYGNKLQNLAVSCVFQKYGAECETLSFERKKKMNIKHEIKYILMRGTKYKLSKSEDSVFYWRYIEKRIRNFKRFDDLYLKQHEDLSLTNSDKYDYYVIGSDQVWNPEFFKYHEMKKDAYLLTFCDDEKKICFSPSFGISTMPADWKEWFKKYISVIPRLSVREEDGKNIIKELTGRDAEVLIDPTLMLSSEEWMKYANKPDNIDLKKRYILTYFLGDKSAEVINQIDRVAKENNLEIYNLLDKSQPEVYTCGPSEFIYMISNASIVITDSFHACVFSFLFNKPFVVYNRKSEYSDMSSRLDTLLTKFDLTSRKSSNIDFEHIFEIEYKNGYDTLEKERKKVEKYFADSLK